MACAVRCSRSRSGRRHRDTVFRLQDSLKLIQPATTLGDVYTLVLHPATSSHRTISQQERDAIGIPDSLSGSRSGSKHIDDIISGPVTRQSTTRQVCSRRTNPDGKGLMDSPRTISSAIIMAGNPPRRTRHADLRGCAGSRRQSRPTGRTRRRLCRIRACSGCSAPSPTSTFRPRRPGPRPRSRLFPQLARNAIDAGHELALVPDLGDAAGLTCVAGTLSNHGGASGSSGPVRDYLSTAGCARRRWANDVGCTWRITGVGGDVPNSDRDR